MRISKKAYECVVSKVVQNQNKFIKQYDFGAIVKPKEGEIFGMICEGKNNDGNHYKVAHIIQSIFDSWTNGERVGDGVKGAYNIVHIGSELAVCATVDLHALALDQTEEIAIVEVDNGK